MELKMNTDFCHAYFTLDIYILMFFSGFAACLLSGLQGTLALFVYFLFSWTFGSMFKIKAFSHPLLYLLWFRMTKPSM